MRRAPSTPTCMRPRPLVSASIWPGVIVVDAGTAQRAAAAGEQGLSEGETMYRCLANGSPAAARFQRDLAAVESAGRSAPPLQAVAPMSLVRAELKARVAEIDTRNVGCGACGGRHDERLRARAPGPPRWVGTTDPHFRRVDT
jgi:hypothetical protein